MVLIKGLIKLEHQLLKYISKEQTQWDLYLDSILFSYCVSQQDSTRHSPFYLVYRKNAKLPIEFDSVPTQESKSGKNSDDNHNENFADEIDSCIEAHEREEHIARMISVRKKALVNIGIAQERQKKYYDAKHSRDKAKYKIGTLVLLKNSKKLTRKGSKLEPNWTGPYKIKEVLSKGTFRLCNANDREKILTSLYNMTKLKLYYDADSSSALATKQASGISPSYQKDTGISANCLNSSHVSGSPPHLIANSPVKGSESPLLSNCLQNLFSFSSHLLHVLYLNNHAK